MHTYSIIAIITYFSKKCNTFFKKILKINFLDIYVYYGNGNFPFTKQIFRVIISLAPKENISSNPKVSLKGIIFMKKIVALILSILLLFCSVLCASALTSHGNGIKIRDNWNENNTKYTFSDGYKTSVWYHNLSQLELTENHRNNVLKIALSQLGYHEGEENDYTGSNPSSSANCTEYARIYSKTYNKNCFDWCATFVNWCLNQAHVDYAYGEMGCQRWIEDYLIPQGLYQKSNAYGGTYTPQPADLIFFDWDKNGYWSDHIGIVLYTTDTTVFTIEGNTSDNVGLKSYPLNDAQIVGYGTPEYIEGTEKTFDYSPSKSFVAGDYVVTDKDLSLFYKADTSAESEALPYGAMVACNSKDGDWVSVKYNGVSGFINSSAITLVQPNVIEYQETTPIQTTPAQTTVVTEDPAASETESEATVGTESESDTPEIELTQSEAPNGTIPETPADSIETVPVTSPETESDHNVNLNVGCQSTLSAAGALAVLTVGAIFTYRKRRK